MPIPLPPLEFPPLFEEISATPWQWPLPPFAWSHAQADEEDPSAIACMVELEDRTRGNAELLRFDAERRQLTLRARGREYTLPFAQLTRLTLTLPLRAAPRRAGAPLERVPAAAQEREFKIEPPPGRPALSGRTAGSVERPEGLYLYPPLEEERGVLRVFVPATAIASCTFGPSAEELAARRWIATPEALLAALDAQRRTPVIPIGQALLGLGLITPKQLDSALKRQHADVPLGEMLVGEGLIRRADLQTALAHKMGYPLVDLARFPIDPGAARALPLRHALVARSLPLMIDGKRLIVAMDRPARVAKLGALRAFSQYAVVPVLASHTQILLAFTRLVEQDVWASNVVAIPPFFPTTAG